MFYSILFYLCFIAPADRAEKYPSVFLTLGYVKGEAIYTLLGSRLFSTDYPAFAVNKLDVKYYSLFGTNAPDPTRFHVKYGSVWAGLNRYGYSSLSRIPFDELKYFDLTTGESSAKGHKAL